jgi:hypothetical protein
MNVLLRNGVPIILVWFVMPNRSVHGDTRKVVIFVLIVGGIGMWQSNNGNKNKNKTQ